jgi:hypothetical protein
LSQPNRNEGERASIMRLFRRGPLASCFTWLQAGRPNHHDTPALPPECEHTDTGPDPGGQVCFVGLLPPERGRRYLRYQRARREVVRFRCIGGPRAAINRITSPSGSSSPGASGRTHPDKVPDLSTVSRATRAGITSPGIPQTKLTGEGYDDLGASCRPSPSGRLAHRQSTLCPLPVEVQTTGRGEVERAFSPLPAHLRGEGVG